MDAFDLKLYRASGQIKGKYVYHQEGHTLLHRYCEGQCIDLCAPDHHAGD